jgi:hypothetical protein
MRDQTQFGPAASLLFETTDATELNQTEHH